MRLDHALVLVVTALGGCDAAVTDALDEGQGDLDVDAASAPAVDMATVADLGRVDLGGARDLAVKRDLAMPDGAMPDLAEAPDFAVLDMAEPVDETALPDITDARDMLPPYVGCYGQFCYPMGPATGKPPCNVQQLACVANFVGETPYFCGQAGAACTDRDQCCYALSSSNVHCSHSRCCQDPNCP